MKRDAMKVKRGAMKCSCAHCGFWVRFPATDCRYGSQCRRGDCGFAHPSPSRSAASKCMAGSSALRCRFGIKCTATWCARAHPSPSLECQNDERGLAKSFSALSSRPPQPTSSLKRSLSGLAKTFGIDDYFIYCLERAFGDRTQQLCVLLVDLG